MTQSPPATRAQLVQELRALGIGPGDMLMLHASVRAVGPVYGGPDEIHLALEEAAAPGGTLMMYVGCPHGVDDVGRGKLSAEEDAGILAHQPAFDPATARAARDFGALAELFRSWPGTLCSATPARFAARGARAAWLTSDQPWNYAYGRGSPLDKLCGIGGKVVLLGSRHDEVTLLHHAEHIADFPGKRIARFRVPVREDGQRVWRPCEEFNTSGDGVHPNWPTNFFEQIVDDFAARSAETPQCRSGRVGNAPTLVLDAGALVGHAIPLMIAKAGEPRIE